MTDNMKLWDAVSKTNPDHTKKVSQRGGFTAIDAHYQIESATRAFGTIGVGWGYDCEYLFQGTAVICLVTLWHGKRENKFGPIAGCAEMTGKRVDTDAPKKAMTDGITKALSHLGFNADVFLGKFDDNKYVQERRAEEAANQPIVATTDDQAWLNAINAGNSKLEDIIDINHRNRIAKLLTQEQK